MYWNRCCQSKVRPLAVLGVAVLCCMLVRWIASFSCKYLRVGGLEGVQPPSPRNSNLLNLHRTILSKTGPREKFSGSNIYQPCMSFLVKSFEIRNVYPWDFFIGLTFQLDLFAVTRSKCPQSSFFDLQRAYESLAVAQRERHVSSLLTIRTTTNRERSTTDKLIEKASSSSFVN